MTEDYRETPIVSFSKDNRFMYVDAAAATPKTLRFLLENMGKSQSSICRVIAFPPDVSDIIDSREIFTGDPEADDAYLEMHIQDLLNATYIVVERLPIAPAKVRPEVEFEI